MPISTRRHLESNDNPHWEMRLISGNPSICVPKKTTSPTERVHHITALVVKVALDARRFKGTTWGGSSRVKTPIQVARGNLWVFYNDAGRNPRPVVRGPPESKP